MRTPSGVLDVRNSTQASGSSVNLVLSDMSSIQAPEVVVQDEDDNENEIIFDELQAPEEHNFLVDSSEDTDNDATLEEVTLEEATEIDDDDDDDINFLPCQKAPDDSKKDDRYSSGSKSGINRHICREVNDVSFACDVCGQVCKNPGSLKRHKNSKHGQNRSLSATASNSTSSTANNSSGNGDTTCQICDKVLSTKANVRRHLSLVHAVVSSLPAQD